MALRYLRARRREGFISVIAGFSFAGIMLGVATLIIVLSVMNGFRSELLNKIVGINGHIFIAPIDKPLTDYAELAATVNQGGRRQTRIPLGRRAGAGLLPGSEPAAYWCAASAKRTSSASPPSGTRSGRGRWMVSITGGGVAIGSRLAEQLFVRPGDTSPSRRRRALRRPSASRRASRAIRSRLSSRSGCRSSTAALSICRSRRRRPTSTGMATLPPSRSSSTTPDRIDPA